jgi:hypothetical protein
MVVVKAVVVVCFMMAMVEEECDWVWPDCEYRRYPPMATTITTTAAIPMIILLFIVNTQTLKPISPRAEGPLHPGLPAGARGFRRNQRC